MQLISQYFILQFFFLNYWLTSLLIFFFKNSIITKFHKFVQTYFFKKIKIDKQSSKYQYSYFTKTLVFYCLHNKIKTVDTVVIFFFFLKKNFILYKAVVPNFLQLGIWPRGCGCGPNSYQFRSPWGRNRHIFFSLSQILFKFCIIP